MVLFPMLFCFNFNHNVVGKSDLFNRTKDHHGQTLLSIWSEFGRNCSKIQDWCRHRHNFHKIYGSKVNIDDFLILKISMINF